ncbi:stage VI sporulation protein D [Pullulanibacillus sp. KACC 23026]|uniref:stage VI sporulation protein D n=1 Tax=Pullulanibacillus sp. KACC 23026 TaxID=3028315 RepID=UPI0023B14237|nr:stage VI sporulation protein D [Pullulanibacillus sp. KACC 23026]WEG14042.1 stage VI sporulation protein D [Pullulanibacillus sp. KACC 23026]
MSHASSQSLQFSIDETIWLRNGYEAEEILSLALDPDITIEETSQYVAIRGSLRLTGEYKPAVQDEVIERTEDVSYRVIDEIMETEDGTAYMEHHFPVDITIPANRVRAIEDVYVTVDSLDYVQPNKGCLQLQADISISGLVNPDLQAIDSRQEESYQEKQENAYDPLDTVNYEAYREPDEEEPAKAPQIDFKEREEEAIEELSYQTDFEEAADAQDGVLFQTEDEEEEIIIPVRSENIPMESEPETETGFKQFETPTMQVNTGLKKGTEAAGEENKQPAVQVSESAPAVPSTPAPEPEQTAPIEENVPSVAEEVDHQESVEEKPKIKRRDENALYLTKMLTSENEQFTKVKICIVQEGDNLETIANRYKVPVTNILRRNQLSTESLDEGQVLYIPVKG